MLGSGRGSICEIFSNASSVVSCGGCSTGAEVASDEGAGGESGVEVGVRVPAPEEIDGLLALGETMLLPPAVNSPFPPLFLRFCGGGGLTTKLRGDKLPLARKMTSLHRLQSSSSS